MNNREIAGILDKISILLTMKGANPFKIKAFEKAARVVGAFDGSIQDMTRFGELQTIEGIGKGIAAEIESLVEKGRSPALTELLKEFPSSIFEIVEIPGVGPKKAVQLYSELKIDSLEDLERAARGGLLRKIKGFGEKSEQGILAGVLMKKQALEQKSLGVVLPLTRRIMSELAKSKSLEKISETGDLRRRRETVKTAEILASGDPLKITDEFIALFDRPKILNKNLQRVSLEDSGGIPFNLEICEKDRFGVRLFQTTGPAGHADRIARILQQSGYSIKNGGLYNSSGVFIPAGDEESVYKMCGIPYIPPEAREENAGVEKFLNSSGFRLIGPDDIRGDLQMHSSYSDGIASMEEMVKKAVSLGYEYIALTDHSRSLVIANGVDVGRKMAQFLEIDRINEKYKNRFKVFKSAEVDILSDGSLDYPDDILEKMDFVLVSVHSSMKMDMEAMTNRIIKAVSHPLVHCLAHPSGRLINRRPEMKIDWDKLFDAVKTAGVAMEINAHPYRLDLDEHRCRKAKEMGIPIFINTDAHSPEEMELMEYGIFVARRGLLTKEDVVNTGSVEQMEKWLKQKRAG